MFNGVNIKQREEMTANFNDLITDCSLVSAADGATST